MVVFFVQRLGQDYPKVWCRTCLVIIFGWKRKLLALLDTWTSNYCLKKGKTTFNALIRTTDGEMWTSESWKNLEERSLIKGYFQTYRDVWVIYRIPCGDKKNFIGSFALTFAYDEIFLWNLKTLRFICARRPHKFFMDISHLNRCQNWAQNNPRRKKRPENDKVKC